MNLSITADSSCSSEGQKVRRSEGQAIVEHGPRVPLTNQIACCMIDVSGRRCWSCGLQITWKHGDCGLTCYLMRSSLQVEHMTLRSDAVVPGVFGGLTQRNGFLKQCFFELFEE